MSLRTVSYKVLYNDKNITKDISDHLLSLEYTDKVTGESDEISLELEDKDGLWQNDWYPDKGAKLIVDIINDVSTLSCGAFTIEELSLSCSRDGDAVTISGLAASITKKLRTKRFTAHENKTLKEIAKTVADRNSLTLQGTIPDITFNRITQNDESDLKFLNRLANLYGLVFSVRDNILTFQKQIDLESKSSVLSIDKTDGISFEFKDKTEKTAKTVNVNYHNPETNKLIEASAIVNQTHLASIGVGESDTFDEFANSNGSLSNTGALVGTATINDVVKGTQQADSDDSTASDDENVNDENPDNSQQAESIADAKAYNIVTKSKTVSASIPGNTLIVSGVNVELTGFGKYSGVYQVLESTHSISRDSEYITGFEAKKVGTVTPKKYLPKKKKGKNSVGVAEFKE